MDPPWTWTDETSN